MVDGLPRLSGRNASPSGNNTHLKPKNPGILVAFHQGMALSITLAIVAAGH
jgi:hypothetical protein